MHTHTKEKQVIYEQTSLTDLFNTSRLTIVKTTQFLKQQRAAGFQLEKKKKEHKNNQELHIAYFVYQEVMPTLTDLSFRARAEVVLKLTYRTVEPMHFCHVHLYLHFDTPSL